MYNKSSLSKKIKYLPFAFTIPLFLVIETPKFFLGQISTQFISGSEGNVEISSSKFHLQPDGDVIMAGTVTATAGEIGGFTIDSDEIKSGTNIALNLMIPIFQDLLHTMILK